MEKTAVIYARVSTVKQADDGLPIDSQIDHGRRKAESMGAAVLKVFTDAGISGRTDDRPAFRDAVLFAKARSVDYFICWSTSRFARNKIDAALYKRELEKHGTRVVYVSVDLDNRTDAGWMLESFLEIFDEHYSRQVAADTLRSMVKNARDGYFNGGRVPFGYVSVPDGKRKRLQIDPADAGTIGDIFAWYLQGAGAKTIAMRLNEQGRLKRGKTWDKNGVIATLKNDVYTGCVVFGRVNGATGRPRPKDEWIVVPSHHAIVTEEVFMKVQSLFGERAPSDGAGSPKSALVFTGLLRCGRCGAAMQTESATGRNRVYHYYNCSAAQKGAGCTNRRIPAADLDEWLIDEILGKLFTRDRVLEIVSEIHRAAGQWVKERARRREGLVSELRQAESRLQKLYDILELHGKDAPNLGDLTERLREIKNQRNKLEAALIELEEEPAPSPLITDVDVAEMADLLRDIVTSAHDPVKKRMFFSSFISRIVVGEKEIRIEYRPEKLVNMAGFDVVHSDADWLPDLDSNQGPAD